MFRTFDGWRDFLEFLRTKRKHETETLNIMATIQVDINITETNPTPPPPPPPLTVDATGVPGTATTGTPFSGAIKASGGTPPYSFTSASGTLPSGLTLGADGTITGTPDGSDVPVGTSVPFAEVINVSDSAA